MRILIIEDEQKFIDQAKEELSGHELTFATTCVEAEKLLTGNGHWFKEDAEFPFDVVLTDLHLPISYHGTGETKVIGRNTETKEAITVPTTKLYGESIPYGVIFAMAAMRRGVPVAICSQGGHHNSPMNFTLDIAGDSGKVVMIGGCKFLYDEYKKWGESFKKLVG